MILKKISKNKKIKKNKQGAWDKGVIEWKQKQMLIQQKFS